MSFIFTFLSPAVNAQQAADDLGGGENGYFSTGQQTNVQHAQATMASLFGKNTVMAVPPQIAGGTIALPSFDSKELVIEKEAVNED